MEKRNIQTVAEILTDKAAIEKKEAASFATTMFEVIQEGLNRDGIVKVKGLGTFKVIDVEARESVNVNTGERVLIDSHSKITFTPDTTMKELVNKPFSQFETVILNDGVSFEDMAAEQAAAEAEAFPESKAPIEKFFEEDDENKEVEKEKDVSSGMDEETPVEEEISVEPEIKEPEDIDTPEAPEIFEPIYDQEIPEPTDSQESPDEQEQEVEMEETEESETPSSSKWWLFSLISLLLIAAAALGGYWYGRKTAFQEMNTQIEKTPIMKAVEKDSLKTDTIAEKDSVTVTPVTETQETEEKTVEPVKPEAAPTPKPVEEPAPVQTEPAKPVLDKYEQMDSRVRTGAYKIMGTAQEVTVKPGETLKRISHFYLGEGMECYMEVYNGLSVNSPLKAGQKIKIPKLVLKKKLRQQKK